MVSTTRQRNVSAAKEKSTDKESRVGSGSGSRSRSRSKSQSRISRSNSVSVKGKDQVDVTSMFKQSSVESLLSDVTEVDSGYQNDFYYRDKIDPSIGFLYRPHTISGLVLMLSVFLWAALQDTIYLSPESNIKLGVGAAFLTFLFFGVVYLPNGPFIRPHPAIWRFVLGLSVLYLMMLVFILFQDKKDMRRWLVFVDGTLGRALPEKSYAANCDLTFENIVDQFDIFVVAHSLGWFGKALIMRDEWFLWILSIMFEFLEYSLQHQLPNFAECWWDHWILDVLLCNWFGLWVGMKTCAYFSMQTYEWRGFTEIPNVRGKVSRSFQQFLPHSFTSFQWAPTSSPTNYFGSVMILFLFLVCELNAFYLKYLLWIPPSHVINILRLCLYFLMGTVAVREAYQLINDKKCKRLGSQAWICIASILTETLICFKYGRGEFPAPHPTWMIVSWSLFALFFIVGFPIYVFILRPRQK